MALENHLPPEKPSHPETFEEYEAGLAPWLQKAYGVALQFFRDKDRPVVPGSPGPHHSATDDVGPIVPDDLKQPS